jgi:hypothetical protein
VEFAVVNIVDIALIFQNILKEKWFWQKNYLNLNKIVNMDFNENPQLSQTLKELEQLEKYIQDYNGDFSEEEVNKIVDKATAAFELTQNELKKLEKYSLEDLEKIIKDENEE